MTASKINFSRLQTGIFDLKKTTSLMDVSGVFPTSTGTGLRQRSYIDELRLFVAHFGSIPNLIEEREIDCKKANAYFMDKYVGDIKDFYFSKRQLDRNKKAELDDIFYFLYEDMVVYFDIDCSKTRFMFRKTPVAKVEEVIEGIQKFKERKYKETPKISLLINTHRGIETKALGITKAKLSIDDNYNDDFKEIHETIVKRLSTKNDKGLVLLHGKPGTGKTSYIRFLISFLKKNAIFLPPNMAKAITNPDLMLLLIDNPNSIFVIEDAENIVVDRDENGSSPVSALLNISDGLLSDCLNIQIICSFNTDISKIDSALMRKGRLIAKYEFKELETEKAQQLSEKLGYSTTIDKPMALASIYNQEEKNFQQTRTTSSIGFRVINKNRLAEN